MVYFKPVRDDAGPAVHAMKQYSGPSPVLKAISYTLLLFLIHPIFSNHIFLLSCIFFSTFIWKTYFSGEKILLVKCHIMWENEHRYAVIILTKAACLTKRTCLFFADTTNHTSIFERSPVFRRSTRKFPSFSSCHFFISFPASRFFLYLQQIFNALLGLFLLKKFFWYIIIIVLYSTLFGGRLWHTI